MRDERADAKIVIHVIRNPACQEVRALYDVRRQTKVGHDLERHGSISGLHVEKCEVPFTCAPVKFYPAIERYLNTIKEADIPAEKWYELLSQPQAECVLVGALQKECALFREEQREAREVDLSGIDLCFSEVSVHSKD